MGGGKGEVMDGFGMVVRIGGMGCGLGCVCDTLICGKPTQCPFSFLENQFQFLLFRPASEFQGWDRPLSLSPFKNCRKHNNNNNEEAIKGTEPDNLHPSLRKEGKGEKMYKK